jgi:hypothetical protein
MGREGKGEGSRQPRLGVAAAAGKKGNTGRVKRNRTNKWQQSDRGHITSRIISKCTSLLACICIVFAYGTFKIKIDNVVACYVPWFPLPPPYELFDVSHLEFNLFDLDPS